MGIFLVFVLPIVVGFGLIFLMARYSPNVPRIAPLRAGQKIDERPEITADEFSDLVRDLLDALGLETVFSSAGTGGVVDVTARDPRPLTGGRILLHATPVMGGQIDAVDVLSFAEGVRADMGALKGIFIALAGFTDEAHAGVRASPAPVDLVDGSKLLELVREHLPDRAEQLEGYRGFDRVASRHVRAGREERDGKDLSP
ncbi:MAG: restriction endonuclease [Polyangiaceae bacterium]|nr:restriction endonuclease [Polyangiaceae bacterium]